MKPLTRALVTWFTAMPILAIASWLTVNNCTDEQLKWTPLIVVATMVLVVAIGFVNAVLQDMKDKVLQDIEEKPESI